MSEPKTFTHGGLTLEIKRAGSTTSVIGRDGTVYGRGSTADKAKAQAVELIDAGVFGHQQEGE